MNLDFSDEEEAFRGSVRAWLDTALQGEFAALRGRGGPGDEHASLEGRRAWERVLGASEWACVGWPKEQGGRGASLNEQVIFHEEYARARAPGRLGHIGEMLLGPTVIEFGTEAQKQRFLPPIARGEEFWCQGYSEPNAGSDLANVQTRAELVGGAWVINGQKTWTSLAHCADWCFVLCRTNPTAPRHKGISYLLVPMRSKGIEVRAIEQLTGTSEFNEVFFDNVRIPAENVLGPVDGGWRVAMATLAFERGTSTLGQQHMFANELAEVIAAAKANGTARDPAIRQRLASAWMGLQVMRWNTLRTLSLMQGGELRREAMIAKLYWSNWHRDLGKLAMDMLGASAGVVGPGYELTALQRLFLFTRADTIYAGSNEIQRNIIGERALGLPPEPRAVPSERRES